MRRALQGNPPITTNHGEAGWGLFGKHAGFDYGVNGAQVVAPEAGTIINIYPNTPGGGNIIELQGKYTHRFLHLKTIKVAKGNKVVEGQVIGISGATGNVTGPHLHHDVRKNGTAWNASYSNYVDWEKLISAPAQGGLVMDTDAKVKAQYFTLRGSEGTPAERKGWIGKSYAAFNKVARPEATARQKAIASVNTLKTQKANLQKVVKAQKATIANKDARIVELVKALEIEQKKPKSELKWHEHLVQAVKKLMPLVKS